ncbi:MAG: sigma-70 family RNA polymerase sigma factor [Firmicutes bacterium]|nr:sigma-70 family RNA polymerase sigma factor [Bacillota bacterium]
MKNDEILYHQYQAGDENAADQLVERYGDALTIYIYGFTGNIHDAEDLMIEAFSLMFAKARPVSEPGSFKGYLFKIGRNLAGRYKKKKVLKLLSFEELTFEPKSDILAETSVYGKERKLLLYNAMAKLKEEYREALYLVYFEDLSYRQAAAVMGKSESQITKLVYRGKQSLKNILKKDGFDYEDK